MKSYKNSIIFILLINFFSTVISYDLKKDINSLLYCADRQLTYYSTKHQLRMFYNYPSLCNGFNLLTHPTVLACLAYGYYKMSEKTEDQDSHENNLENKNLNI